MYPLKPVFDLDAKVDLPNCMYQMPIIQVSKNLNDTSSSASGGADSAMKALAKRQEDILSKLEQFKAELETYRTAMGLSNTVTPIKVTSPMDIVVRCSPHHPPYTVPSLVNILSKQLKVHTSCHTHSSVSHLPHHLTNFITNNSQNNNNITTSRSEAQVKFTLIWKEVGKECEVMVSPLIQTQIKGEVNLLRYVARQFPTVLPYENEGDCSAVDNLLDCVTALLWALPKERQPLLRPLAINLGKSPFLAGDVLCLADLALYSTIRQLGLDKDLQPEFRRWFALVAAKLGGRSHRRSSRYSGNYRRSFRNSRRFSEKEKTPPSSGGKKNNGGQQNNKSEHGKQGNNNNNKNRRDSHKEKTPPNREKSPKKTVTVKA